MEKNTPGSAAMDFYEELLKARKENKEYVTATVVETQGTTPRSAGCKMLLLADGTVVGTVGGGNVEREAMADCKAAMKTGKPLLKKYAVITSAVQPGTDCENNVTVFIEPGERRPYLYLCGCGHVAQAVMPLAKNLGYHLVGIDARDVSSFGDALKPLDELILLEDFREIGKVDFVPGSAYIACSITHETDGEVLKVVLQQK
jgi:xanthine dehydrogenase accessory factor